MPHEATQVMLYICHEPDMWPIIRYNMWVRHFIYIASAPVTDPEEQAMVKAIEKAVPGGCLQWTKKQDHVYEFQLNNNNIVLTYIITDDMHTVASLIQPVTSLYINYMCRSAHELDLYYGFDRSLMPSLTTVFGDPDDTFIEEHKDLKFIYTSHTTSATGEGGFNCTYESITIYKDGIVDI